jgi:propanol-preferring alcohol dehydrogenase
MVMKAMLLISPKRPLEMVDIVKPTPATGQLQLRVRACGVCRTDLHVFDGDLAEPKLPLIPGHQIVGTVEMSAASSHFKIGDRVGVPWLGWSCGKCKYCRSGRENLCDLARYTGYHIDGGFAEYCIADERFCFPLPDAYSDIQAAPLLCAGLIGYRAYRMTGDATRIGFYGFGAAAHILIQLAKSRGREIYAFTRDGDRAGQEFAMKLGAVWAGSSADSPPVTLDAAIIFAPIGPLVPAALMAVDKGGVVVCAGIHMSDIPSFPYSILWNERSIKSVANLTRQDGHEFMELASNIHIQTEVVAYPLERANEALEDLRFGRFQGVAVIIP